jgi:hypothetical protein
MGADAFDGLSFSRFGLVESKKPRRAVCEHLSTPRRNFNNNYKHTQTAAGRSFFDYSRVFRLFVGRLPGFDP